MKGRWQTRGGRVSRNGFRLMWAGLSILLVMLVAAIAQASRPVIVALLVLMVVLVLAGLGIVFVGYGIDKQDLAEYHRQVAAGEIPPWKPGDPPWEPDKRRQAS